MTCTHLGRYLWTLATAGLISFGPVHVASAQLNDGTQFRSYQAHVAAAEMALRLGESAQLVRWLDQAPAEYRGWEWQYLKAASDSSIEKIPLDRAASRISISSDGRRMALVIGSTVELWNLGTWQREGVIDGHGDAVYRAEFSPDGQRLVTVSRDVTSRVWDVASRREIAQIQLDNPAVAAVAFSPDGSQVATCAWVRPEREVLGMVWIWDANSGEILHRTHAGVKPLSSIQYSPDGQRIAVGSWDGLVHLLDTEGHEIRTIALPDEGVYNAVNDLAFYPDGGRIVVGGKDRAAHIFATETGSLLFTLPGHLGYVESVGLSPDGKQLLTTSSDATLRIWNAEDGRPGDVLRGHTQNVHDAVWLMDGSRIISCSFDDNLRVWNPNIRNAAQLNIELGTSGTYSAQFSPDGAYVAVACFDGRAMLLDAHSGRPAVQWKAHPESTCHWAAFDDAGQRMVTCSWDKTVRVWNVADQQQVAVLEAGKGVYGCDISPDGQRVILSADNEIQLWDAAAGQRLETWTLPAGSSGQQVQFSPDGKRAAVAATNGVAYVWDLDDGSQSEVPAQSGGLESVSFSPDSTQIAMAGSAGIVRIWSLATGEWVSMLDLKSGGLNRLAFSPDGQRLAVAAGQQLVILTTSPAVLETIRVKPLTDNIWNLSWSADGGQLAVVSSNGTAAILDAR